MEFIRTIRNKFITSRQDDLQKMSEKVICLGDYDDELYISYNGLPVLPLKKETTVKEIIEKLSELRNNYVEAKMKELSMPKINRL